MTMNLDAEITRMLANGDKPAAVFRSIMTRAAAADLKAWASLWVRAMVDAEARNIARKVEVRSTIPARQPAQPAHTEEDREEAKRRRLEREQDDRESDRRLWSDLRGIMDDFAQSVTLEVTAELLATKFKPGDGTEVTWADATAAQHEQYAGMLLKMAQGDIKTAGRHQVAARLIGQAGATCLGDLSVAS